MLAAIGLSDNESLDNHFSITLLCLFYNCSNLCSTQPRERIKRDEMGPRPLLPTYALVERPPNRT